MRKKKSISGACVTSDRVAKQDEEKEMKKKSTREIYQILPKHLVRHSFVFVVFPLFYLLPYSHSVRKFTLLFHSVAPAAAAAAASASACSCWTASSSITSWAPRVLMPSMASVRLAIAVGERVVWLCRVGVYLVRKVEWRGGESRGQEGEVKGGRAAAAAACVGHEEEGGLARKRARKMV